MPTFVCLFVFLFFFCVHAHTHTHTHTHIHVAGRTVPSLAVLVVLLCIMESMPCVCVLYTSACPLNMDLADVHLKDTLILEHTHTP